MTSKNITFDLMANNPGSGVGVGATTINFTLHAVLVNMECYNLHFCPIWGLLGVPSPKCKDIWKVIADHKCKISH